jgi:CAAX protease family protein
MAYAEQTIPTPRPWGYFATAGWLVLAVLISMALGIAVVEWLLGVAADSGLRPPLYETTLWIGMLAVLALAARLRHWSVKDYFGLVRPSNRQIAISLASLAMLLAAEYTVIYLTGWRTGSRYTTNLYASARAAGIQSLLWLMFYLAIAAPIVEEMIFRGFLYRGWARTPRGVVPAILVISALFALLHMQYNRIGILITFCSSLLYGWARWWSGSTLLAILLHGVNNLWAMVVTVARAEWLS